MLKYSKITVCYLLFDNNDSPGSYVFKFTIVFGIGGKFESNLLVWPGWDRVKVFENLGVTTVVPVTPVDTSLLSLFFSICVSLR